MPENKLTTFIPMLTGKGVTGDRLNYEVGFTEGYASVPALKRGDRVFLPEEIFFVVEFRKMAKK